MKEVFHIAEAKSAGIKECFQAQAGNQEVESSVLQEDPEEVVAQFMLAGTMLVKTLHTLEERKTL